MKKVFLIVFLLCLLSCIVSFILEFSQITNVTGLFEDPAETTPTPTPTPTPSDDQTTPTPTPSDDQTTPSIWKLSENIIYVYPTKGGKGTYPDKDITDIYIEELKLLEEDEALKVPFGETDEAYICGIWEEGLYARASDNKGRPEDASGCFDQASVTSAGNYKGARSFHNRIVDKARIKHGDNTYVDGQYKGFVITFKDREGIVRVKHINWGGTYDLTKNFYTRDRNNTEKEKHDAILLDLGNYVVNQ